MGTVSRDVGLTIMDSQRAPLGAVVQVRELTPSVRLLRALLRLLLVWGVGAACVIIPVVHFIVPPLALLTAPWFAWRVWRQRVLLSPGTVACPRCSIQAEVPEKTPGWPAALFCGSCGTTFFARPTG